MKCNKLLVIKDLTNFLNFHLKRSFVITEYVYGWYFFTLIFKPLMISVYAYALLPQSSQHLYCHWCSNTSREMWSRHQGNWRLDIRTPVHRLTLSATIHLYKYMYIGSINLYKKGRKFVKCMSKSLGLFFLLQIMRKGT